MKHGTILLVAWFVAVVAGCVSSSNNALDFLQQNVQTSLYYQLLSGAPSSFLAELRNSTVTYFAPTDAAINAVVNNLPANGTAELNALISYFIAPGAVLSLDTFQVVPTYYRPGGLGNASQVLQAFRSPTTGQSMLNQQANVVFNATGFDNGSIVYMVDMFLFPPSDMVTALDSFGLSNSSALLSASGLGNDSSRTFFAPSDAAFSQLNVSWLGFMLLPEGQFVCQKLIHHMRLHEVVYRDRLAEQVGGSFHPEEGNPLNVTSGSLAGELCLDSACIEPAAAPFLSETGAFYEIDSVLLPLDFLDFSVLSVLHGSPATNSSAFFSLFLSISLRLSNLSTDYTVFAPTNAAWEEVSGLLSSATMLEQVLLLHIVPQRIAPYQLVSGAIWNTLLLPERIISLGSNQVQVEGHSASYDRATLVAPGGQLGANGWVYVIDGVLGVSSVAQSDSSGNGITLKWIVLIVIGATALAVCVFALCVMGFYFVYRRVRSHFFTVETETL